MKQILWALSLIAVLPLGACGDSSSAQRSTLPPGIGDVNVVVRLVHGTLANHDAQRILAVQDDVYWRELIETGQESATEVEFVDGTRLTIGADAKVNLDEFVYGGPPGTDRMVMTVTKGMSRFVTGSMDKAAYEIRAPGAIIGVRGTEFTLLVDPKAETTLCVVHRGEVEFRSPDGGQRVIIQPGEASKASSKQDVGITPAAPSPTDVIRSAATLRSVVDAAKQEQRAALDTDQQTALVTDTDRHASGQPPRNAYGRERLQDLVRQLRTNEVEDRGQVIQASAATGPSTITHEATTTLPASTKVASVGGKGASGDLPPTAGGTSESSGEPKTPTETSAGKPASVDENAVPLIEASAATGPSTMTDEATATLPESTKAASGGDDDGSGARSPTAGGTSESSGELKTPTETPANSPAPVEQTAVLKTQPASIGGAGGQMECGGAAGCGTPLPNLRDSPIASKTHIRGG